MLTLFSAEIGVMMWILVETDLLTYGPFLTSSHSLSQTLISTTGAFSEHFSVTGYYHNDMEVCYRDPASAYEYIWVPCFVFDANLAVLSLWTAVWHSRQHSRSPRSNKPRLVDVLIQGNVIYFLGCAFSCPHLIGIGIDDRM